MVHAIGVLLVSGVAGKVHVVCSHQTGKLQGMVGSNLIWATGEVHGRSAAQAMWGIMRRNQRKTNREEEKRRDVEYWRLREMERRVFGGHAAMVRGP